MNWSALLASVGALVYSVAFLLLPYSIRGDAFLTFLYGGLGLGVSGVLLLTFFRSGNGVSPPVKAALHVFKMTVSVSLTLAFILYVSSVIHH